MKPRFLAAVLLTVSLTAGAFEVGNLIGVDWCEAFRGTWLGAFCPEEPPGGGGSGAE